MDSKDLTTVERAAIFYGLYNGLPDYKIYDICHPGKSPEKQHSGATAWKNSKRVLPVWREIDKQVKEMKKALAEKSSQHETNLLHEIDFTDRAQFIKYLNESANRIQDDKLKNDILKMLSDHLDFKDSDKRDDANQIQRFYLPLRCVDCVLYQANKE